MRKHYRGEQFMSQSIPCHMRPRLGPWVLILQMCVILSAIYRAFSSSDDPPLFSAWSPQSHWRGVGVCLSEDGASRFYWLLVSHSSAVHCCCLIRHKERQPVRDLWALLLSSSSFLCRKLKLILDFVFSLGGEKVCEVILVSQECTSHPSAGGKHLFCFFSVKLNRFLFISALCCAGSPRDLSPVMIPTPNIRNKTPVALRYFQRITATLPLLPSQ